MLQLPKKCSLTYHPNFLSEKEASQLFSYLLTLPELTNMFSIKLHNGAQHTYDFGKLMFVDSEVKKTNILREEEWGKVIEWPHELVKLKRKVEVISGDYFATCVCIFYPDGNSGVDFHSDLIAFGDTNLIPSLSLGAERNFQLREKSTQSIFDISLKHGSLLIMGDRVQELYEHALPLDSSCKAPRINITFRKFGNTT